MNNQDLFVHQAKGYALGGTLVKPEQAFIKPQACVALPSIGGFDSSRADSFSHPGISFESAHSEVIGISRQDKPTIQETQVQTTILGLNIQGVVTAESITARMVVTTVAEGIQGLGPRPKFSFAGTSLNGLMIDGQPYTLNSSAHFNTVLTRMQSLFDRSGGARLVSSLSDHREALDHQAVDVNTNLLQTSGDIDEADIETSEILVIPVAGFGRICIAEVLYNPYICQLSMLRVELDGGGFQGDLLAGAVEGGASCFPGHGG